VSRPDTETGVSSGDGPTPRRGPSADARARELAAEQAALRRVATLVAAGTPPAEVFSAVADELARLVGADATFVSSLELYDETSGYTMVEGSYGQVRNDVPVGFRMKLEPGMVTTVALCTGRPARASGAELANGPYGSLAQRLGLRAAMATPIVVEGSYWGVAVAATAEPDFPVDAEARMTAFTELAALAIANAQAEQKLHELVRIQESLRRLALLVARGEPPAAVFAAVAREVLRHFGGHGTARLVRYEPDGTVTLLANQGTTGPYVRVGKPWEDYPPTGLTATVLRTGRPARVNDYRALPGGEQYAREGILSAVGLPIHVGGRLWGMIAVGWNQVPLPPGAEERMADFTELVAIAVANAQSRAELLASRLRIITASDEARRRFERDLHDGAQQRLVALALALRSALPAQPEPVATEVAHVAAELLEVIDDLREISRGIHPAVLSSAGLDPALRTLARRSVVPVDVEVRIEGRLPEPVEVCAYYIVAEMLTNSAKHARASVVHVTAEVRDASLLISVRDDGVGGARQSGGSGLVGLRDRVEALGGTFSVDSPAGHGTAVSARLPIEDATMPDAVAPEP
jgi:signal transduction histidine kinase